MSVFLNVRETAWDYLTSKGLSIDIDVVEKFAKEFGCKEISYEEHSKFLRKIIHNSYDFDKILSKIDETGDSGEDDIAGLEPSFIITNHTCSQCNTTYTKYGLNNFLRLLYIDPHKENDLCPNCFVKQLRERNLTEQELEILAEELYKSRHNLNHDFDGVWNQVSLPEDIFTQTQLETINVKVKEIEKQVLKEKEDAITQKYNDRAGEYVKNAGLGELDTSRNLVKLVGLILRDIDEKFEKAYNKVPLSEMIFR